MSQTRLLGSQLRRSVKISPINNRVDDKGVRTIFGFLQDGKDELSAERSTHARRAEFSVRGQWKTRQDTEKKYRNNDQRRLMTDREVVDGQRERGQEKGEINEYHLLSVSLIESAPRR